MIQIENGAWNLGEYARDVRASHRHSAMAISRFISIMHGNPEASKAAFKA
jgi:hypothetical protein